MIGSPASRGATASTGWRACLAASALTVNAVRAATVASATSPGGRQRRIAVVDCAVVIRSFMPYPGPVPVRVRIDQIAIFGLRNHSHLAFRIRRYQGRPGGKSLIYEGSRRRKVVWGRGCP